MTTRVRRVTLIIVLLLGAAAAAGCGPPANPQALREEALKADPSFAQVLEKRDEMASRIMQLERELDLKRNQVERQIAQLRKDLTDAQAQVNQKVQKTKALLTPDLERLNLALSTADEERRAKQSQRASLGRSISRIRKSLKEDSGQWTKTERARMERELDELLRETKRIDQELAILNQHVHRLKIKRLLLRL